MNKKYIYAMWYHGEDHDPEASWDNDDAEWFNTCAEAIDAAQELIDAGTPGEDIVVMKFDREYQDCMWDDYMRFDSEATTGGVSGPKTFSAPSITTRAITTTRRRKKKIKHNGRVGTQPSPPARQHHIFFRLPYTYTRICMGRRNGGIYGRKSII